MNLRFLILRSLVVLMLIIFLPAKSFSTHLESRMPKMAPAVKLSPAAQNALLHPPRSLSRSVRDELSRHLKKSAEPVLRAFLKSRFDQMSYKVSSAQLRSGNAIHFSAQGLSADHPHTKIVLEIFYKGGDQAVGEFYGRWFEPTTDRDGWIRRYRFPTADSAAHTNLKDETTEAFFWQRGEYYVEVWNARKVKVFAQQVHATLETKGFYDFANNLMASADGRGQSGHSRADRLMRAVKEGDLERVDRLIRRGADLQGAPGETTPLILASELGRAQIVDSLVRAGADVHAIGPRGRNALFKAVEKNHVVIVKNLIAAGSEIPIKDDRGATLLAVAARNGNAKILRALMKAGADVNGPRIYLAEKPVYRTPLMEAVENNKPVAIIVLLNAKADPNLHGERGVTPLMIAAEKGWTDIAIALLARGADRRTRNDDNQTALSIAEAKGHENIAGLLKGLSGIFRHDRQEDSRYDRGAAVSNQYRPRDSALVQKDLIAAGKNGDTSRLFDLIGADRGDVNVTDPGGNTSLMFAAFHGHGSMVNTLLNETSADVNKANNDGNSALLYAAQKGDDWIVNILLLAGADINHRNAKGKTALNYANEQGHSEVVLSLNSAGAR